MEHEIISFDLAKINRGKEKICKCKKPHYEIDTTNRLVMCTDCGAILEPFDALLSLAERMEEVEKLQNKMIGKAKTYSELASEEFSKLIRSRVFRNMNEKYKNGMFPICPECNTPFEPTEIQSWINESLVDWSKEAQT